MTKIKNMEEFAALSGISRPTVSKYFHDPDSVRPTTRARIEEALERFDYRPNIYAVNQNRKLTKNIGIVVPYLADPFFAEIARYLEQSCIAAGYRPSLFSSHGEQKLENEILDGLQSLKPAGVLLAPLGRTSDRSTIEKFCANVPTILFDSNLDGLGAAFVGSDNFSFVSQTVEYMTRTGEPPSFFEMRTPANPNANKRRKAYVDVMERLGFEPHIIKVDGTGWAFEEIGHRGALKVLQERGLKTDSVLCSNDRLAIGFLAACFEQGIRVGRKEDCSLRVASNDDHPFAKFTCPSLTTAAHDYDNVAGRSVETLFELIESGGKFSTRTETLFPARLVLRDSA
ncbi:MULTISPECIES: LacI family DNA-binding transcriptional regulator [unclassified Ruegeria]|uniref:LacI family DNA-binding transcriptional regulator n=1 Tax=unclassified Ruegeria TaxID=2625375 RepID=UPI001489BCE8|nr:MULTISPECIES: LacI family DNA-binding transcriptional regulator [unclassified Ruegeria]NOD35674.1 substrate-binding domain-containing protein [Ruegeria sp. HKCCD7296]NOD47177.1 substrate-binding domain-containing protein [Ruegeria sp. HKCCD5849]NOD51500.1 substrate-binding domain-containing protein [Ruegeria sp. HKCCD5851]NOD69355.1 substrate-binding domain-containing protein [Ruegeria sp. HKCCD7303]NOE36334.1 substrate-binding domain-containing protein [Ruegeria sp. HKCCD7318]